MTFEEVHLEAFADLTDDRAPVHFDREHAISLGFQDRIVHGFLVSSIFSEILGCDLPGSSSVIQKFSVDLIAPVYIGVELAYLVEVTRVSEAVGAVSLSLKAVDVRGTTVCRGSAVCVVKGQ